MRFLITILLPVLASAFVPGTKQDWRNEGKSSNLRTGVQSWRNGQKPSDFGMINSSCPKKILTLDSETKSGLTSTSTPQNCLEEDLSDLVYLRAQLREIQTLIAEKKRSISANNGHYRDTIADCDNVRCVGRVMAGTSSTTMNRRPVGRYGQPRNPTCNSSKTRHSSYTSGNKPNSLLPVCRYPEPIAYKPQAPYHTPSRGQGYSQYQRPHCAHSHRHDSKAKNFFKSLGFWFLGLASAFVLFVIHRRSRDPTWAARRAERITTFLARRTERRNRRAARRAAFKQAINKFLGRLGCQKSTENFEAGEKHTSLLDTSDEASPNTIADDISEFRSVSDIVSDLVAAEESRSQASARSDGSLFESGSQSGDEQLPPYEGHDGSDTNSSVPDGFMYTPGSTEYTPSSAGDASDILGPDKD
jgi:hypothetical protein